MHDDEESQWDGSPYLPKVIAHFGLVAQNDDAARCEAQKIFDRIFTLRRAIINENNVQYEWSLCMHSRKHFLKKVISKLWTGLR